MYEGHIENDVSRWTVARRLKEANLFARVAAQKDLLTDDHKRQRMEFATAFLQAPPGYFENVIFTDEKCFGYIKI